MAKDKNNKPDKKPVTPAPASKKEEKGNKEPITVVQVGDLLDKAGTPNAQKSTLSPDATVMALNGLKTMVHDNPNAAEYYGMSDEAVQKINKFTLAGFATVLAIECATRKSEFAIRMLEKQPEAINAISEYTGVSIDVKALPAPKDGQVTIPSSAVKVTKEAKEKIKKEETMKKAAELDPTKIENEEQLRASLAVILSDMKEPRPYDRIAKVITFYLSYLTFQAEKSDNKDAELEKIKGMSTANLLKQITEVVGPVVYSLEGICRLLRESVDKTKSPVSAFCMFRNSSINPKTGVHIDDNLVADIVKILIVWSGDACVAQQKKLIAASEKIIAAKDPKKDVGVINAEKEKIAKYNANIEYFNNCSEYVTNPSFDLADKFIEAYDDDKHELYASVRRAGRNIFDTYYKGKDMTKANKEALMSNLKNHCGNIINMFRDPLSQSISYKSPAFVDMFPEEGEEKTEPEKK